jgi:hypothetical protein
MSSSLTESTTVDLYQTTTGNSPPATAEEAHAIGQAIASGADHLWQLLKQAEDRRRTLEEAIEVDERDLEVNERTLADLTRDRYKVDSPLTDKMYAELRAPLVKRIEELTETLSKPRAELERLPSPWSARGYKAITTIPESVDGRAWLRKYLSAVEVMSARHRGGRFDPTRVRLHWLSGDVTTDADLRALEEDADWLSDSSQVSLLSP